MKYSALQKEREKKRKGRGGENGQIQSNLYIKTTKFKET
jgi:hypothetical protein